VFQGDFRGIWVVMSMSRSVAVVCLGVQECNKFGCSVS
jgi:hypothetical protein